jgi:hypothetical protein
VSYRAPGMADDRRGLPRFWTQLHRCHNFDRFVSEVFGLKGTLPPRRGQAKSGPFKDALESIRGFATLQIHQTPSILPAIHLEELSDAQYQVWDLSDEAMYELLVAGLMARVGALPHAQQHLRKAMELTLMSGFCNVVTMSRAGGAERPFLTLYATGLWGMYAGIGGSVGSENLRDRARRAGIGRRRALMDFGNFYGLWFSRPYCRRHLPPLVREHRRNHIPPPIVFPAVAADVSGRPCKIQDCKEPIIARAFEKLPSFELLIEVVCANLWSGTEWTKKARAAWELYSESSAAVHVDRGAHVHGPGWDRAGTRRFVRLLDQTLRWSVEAQAKLWGRNDLALPGLVTYLESIRFDLRSVPQHSLESKLSGMVDISFEKPPN